MRVLHVIHSIAPEQGGPAEVIFPMLRALRAYGIEAELVTTDDGLSSGAAAGERWQTLRDVPVRIFHRLLLPGRKARNFGYAPRFAPWLHQAIADYDLLHVHAIFSYLPTRAMQIARQHRIAYLSRPLGQLGSWPLRQSRFVKLAYLTAFERANLRGAKALHFTSQAERDDTARLQLGTPREIVLAHGVSMAKAQLGTEPGRLLRDHYGLSPEKKIILFLGRFHPKKGIELLLAGLARRNDPTLVLILAGSGSTDYEAELRQKIAVWRLTDQVIWAGFVRGETKALCLAGADLFVLVSHHENLGVAVLEALAAGLPVLISEQVALADIVQRRDLGRCVPLRPERVAEELGALLAPISAEEKENGQERRRAYVREHHAWPAQAARLAQVYQSCLPVTATTAKENLERAA